MTITCVCMEEDYFVRWEKSSLLKEKGTTFRKQGDHIILVIPRGLIFSSHHDYILASNDMVVEGESGESCITHREVLSPQR